MWHLQFIGSPQFVIKDWCNACGSFIPHLHYSFNFIKNSSSFSSLSGVVKVDARLDKQPNLIEIYERFVLDNKMFVSRQCHQPCYGFIFAHINITSILWFTFNSTTLALFGSRGKDFQRSSPQIFAVIFMALLC